MADRVDLHNILCAIVNITEADGDRHVYYNPPESIRMKYPCIRYSRKRINNKYANDSVYKQHNSYELVVIDREPDSNISALLSTLPMCTHDRSYKAENLYHDVFTIHH